MIAEILILSFSSVNVLLLLLFLLGVVGKKEEEVQVKQSKRTNCMRIHHFYEPDHRTVPGKLRLHHHFPFPTV